MQDNVIRIVIDPTAAQTGAARANAAYNSIQAAAAQLNRQMGVTQNGMGALGGAANGLGGHLNGFARSAGLSTTNLGRLNVTFGNGTSAAHSYNSAMLANIAAMMRTGTAAQQMAAQMAAAAAAAGQAGAAAGQAGSGASGAASWFDRMRAVAGSAGNALGGMATSMAGLGGMAVVGAAVGASIVLVGANAIDAAAKVEAFKASLTTVVGNAQSAGLAFDALAAFAQKTPFSLDQAVDGFVKLKALGLTPSENAMMSYGNTASAMGKDLNQMIEAVADATTGEFERLKEFGIKTSSEGNKVKLTFQGVTTEIGKNATEIEKYLIGLGNNQFGGAMERQAATIGGALSGLKDQIFLSLAALGGGLFGEAISKIINLTTTGLQSITPFLQSIGSVVGSVVNIVANIASGVGAMFSAITNQGGEGLSMLDYLTLAFNGIGSTVSVMADLVGSGLRGIANLVGWLGDNIRTLLGGAFTWLTGISTKTAGDVGLSFIAMMRAAKFVAEQIPRLFQVAYADIMQMFRKLGSIVGRLLTGDISALKDIGGAFTSSFERTGRVINATAHGAGVIANNLWDAKQSMDAMLGRGKKASIDDFAGVSPRSKPAADSGKDDAAKKAAEAEAKRQQSIKDFWKTLDQSVDLARMLPQEAEKHTKWLELQKLYGDKLSDQDKAALIAAKDKIALKLQEIATGKAITGMTEQTRKLALENGLLDKRKLGLTEQQQTVEDALFSNRLAALTSGVDIASKDFTIAEAALKKELERNAAIKARGDLSKQAASIASSYSPQYDAASQIKSIEADRAKFKMAFESGTLIDGQKISRDLYDSVMKGMDNAVRDVSGHFQDQFLDRIDYVANSFGGKIGRILQSVAGALSNMSSAARGGQMGGVVGLLQTTLGTGAGGKKNTFGEAIDKGAENFYDQVGTAFKNPLDSMSKGFEGFQTNIKSMFGKGGEFSKGLGNILGAAGQGAQIGDMTNSLMKGLGIKTSGTGAQLGGAVGGAAFGPIGSVVGSIAGGLIGGMLKKTKWGTSVVTGQNANGISTAGNSNSRKEYASGAAASIQDGLQGLADQFGTSVGSYLVSIGTYKDKWRVSTTGRDGKLKGGSGRTDIKDFGKDGQAEAIEYAIRDAISDGALTGLKAFTQRVLNDKNYSLDSAVSLATSYENALKELASIDDPLKYSVTSILDPIDQLIAKMKTAGASVSEVADIERLRSEKLKALTEQQLAGLKDFKDILNGEGSGVTQLAQLTAKQTEFDALKAQIASGKAVDQDTFTKLGQEIFGLSRDIYGTANSQFQSIRADLIGVSDQFASLLTSQINSAAGIATTTAITVDTSATDAAVQQQTAALTSAAAVTNETLAKILEALEAANQINSRAGTIYSGGAGNYINGVKVA